MLTWEIMTCQVHTTCPEEHLAMAALIFAKREVSNMPVLDKEGSFSRHWFLLWYLEEWRLRWQGLSGLQLNFGIC